MSQFLGTAAPLTARGVGEATDTLGISAAQLWAVIDVETGGCGFLPDRRPEILFEHPKFKKLTGGNFDAQAPDLSNDGDHYGQAGAFQYERLERAIALAGADVAERCASWGIAQILRENAPQLGFVDVQAMVAAMTASEDQQLQVMVDFIKNNKLQHALASDDFPTFARGYNGENFAEKHYDRRLAAANAKFVHGGLPDLAVRTAQVCLRFLKHDPGRIDGVLGPRTRSAMVAVLQPNVRGATISDITDEMIARLQGMVAELPADV
jgi:N-acetylmuramidase